MAKIVQLKMAGIECYPQTTTSAILVTDSNIEVKKEEETSEDKNKKPEQD